ncbi:hypothetical protein M758_12G000700 [Ceratodon purpureus]|nr:hypothetical protein M758_12G000700 [Ceratodon purpureus]
MLLLLGRTAACGVGVGVGMGMGMGMGGLLPGRRSHSQSQSHSQTEWGVGKGRRGFAMSATAARDDRDCDWSMELSNPSLEQSLRALDSAARIERGFAQRLAKAVREHNLFRPGDKILVAVSGGQDSVCLLRMLAGLREQWGWVLGVVYCDHRWSSASRGQGSHVSQIATSLGVRYYQAVTTSPVPGEGLARTWRYGVLQRIALRHGFTSIVTAHTASDRVETLLYNLFRGSGLHGLQSLTWKRVLSPSLSLSYRTAFTPNEVVSSLATEVGMLEPGSSEVTLVRPLLGFTRTELREYCDLVGLPLWPDPSNMSLEIDRNRIRHELLPYLRENFNDSVDKSLARCAEILHAEQQYLDSVCDSIFRKAETRDADGSKLDIVILQSLPVALQRRVLKQFVENFTGRSLGFDHVERLRASYSLSADTQNASHGVNLALPGNASVRVLKTHFHLTRTKQV